MKGKLLLIFFICAFSVCFTSPALSIPITFDTNDETLIAFTDGDIFNQDFQITNNTNTIWTDFHFLIEGLEGGRGATAQGVFGFVDIAGGGHDGTAYDGPGTYTADAPFLGKIVDVVGLNIGTGAVYEFTLDTDDGESFGDYWIWANPTTNGVSVPEPTIMLLVGVGLLGLGFMRRKFRS